MKFEEKLALAVELSNAAANVMRSANETGYGRERDALNNLSVDLSRSARAIIEWAHRNPNGSNGAGVTAEQEGVSNEQNQG